MYWAASNGKHAIKVQQAWEQGCKAACIIMYAANFMKLGNGIYMCFKYYMHASTWRSIVLVPNHIIFHNFCLAVNMQYCYYLANLQPWNITYREDI